jgi:hypothetical protein
MAPYRCVLSIQWRHAIIGLISLPRGFGWQSVPISHPVLARLGDERAILPDTGGSEA